MRVYANCLSLARSLLVKKSPGHKGLVTMLSASLFDITVRTHFIEAVVAVTQTADQHKSLAPEVYKSHFKALRKVMDDDDSLAAKRL